MSILCEPKNCCRPKLMTTREAFESESCPFYFACSLPPCIKQQGLLNLQASLICVLQTGVDCNSLLFFRVSTAYPFFFFGKLWQASSCSTIAKFILSVHRISFLVFTDIFTDSNIPFKIWCKIMYMSRPLFSSCYSSTGVATITQTIKKMKLLI